MTNQDEWADPTTCIDCGAPIWPEADRAFASAPGVYLCFACAERRGGVYDAAQDRWVTAPDVSGLYDERRLHA
jgi:hypothetical protein